MPKCSLAAEARAGMISPHRVILSEAGPRMQEQEGGQQAVGQT